MRKIISSLEYLIWQRECLCCGREIPDAAQKFCQSCWSNLQRNVSSVYCRRCGANTGVYLSAGGLKNCESCKNEGFAFDTIIRVGAYDGLLRKIILELKNNDSQHINMLRGIIRSALEQAGIKGQIDYLVPVPLHWTKRLVRGFNQSKTISELLTDFAAVNDCLVRTRATKKQVGLSPEARRKNVAGAFAIRKDHEIQGKTVCLVDDIKTTGATLNECAAVLKSAGAAKVYAAVLAVAGNSDSI